MITNNPHFRPSTEMCSRIVFTHAEIDYQKDQMSFHNSYLAICWVNLEVFPTLGTLYSLISGTKAVFPIRKWGNRLSWPTRSIQIQVELSEWATGYFMHCLNQCWLVVNWTLGNKCQWKFDENETIFIQQNELENIICKKAAILSQPQCVNGCVFHSLQPKPNTSKPAKDTSRAYMTRQKPLYHNCQLWAPDGQMLCTCDISKAQWYLDKGLGGKMARCCGAAILILVRCCVPVTLSKAQWYLDKGLGGKMVRCCVPVT